MDVGAPTRGPVPVAQLALVAPTRPQAEGAPATGAAQADAHRSLVGREGRVADQPGPVVRAARPWAVMELPAWVVLRLAAAPVGHRVRVPPAVLVGDQVDLEAPACGPVALGRWVARA